MADFDTPVTGFQISHFGVDPLEALGITSKAQEKAQVVQDQKAMKSLTHGSSEQLRTIATGIRADNDLAQSEAVQDALTLNPVDFVGKYGQEAYENLYRLQNSIQGLEGDKARDRDSSLFSKDSLLDLVQFADQTAYGAAALGTTAYDAIGSTLEKGIEYFAGQEVYDYQPITPSVLAASEENNRNHMEARSPVRQYSMEQQALETALNQADSLAQYERDQAVEDTYWNDIAKFGRDSANAARTYMDNTSAGQSVIAQGAASLIPMSIGARAIAAANTLRAAQAGGMSKTAAQAYLKSTAGRKAVQEEAVRLVPVLSAAMEGSAGLTEAQLEILGMSETELMQSPEYAAMRQNDISHADAQAQLARTAGGVASVAGAGTGFLTGQIAKGFEARPFSVGSSAGRVPLATATQAAGNVAKETAEEFIQEGASQAAVNAGVQSVGLDRSLLDNVAESAVAGALGGAGVSAGVQAPGVAAGTAAEAVRATGAGIAKAVEARETSLNQKANEASPVGSKAQAAAAEESSAAASAIVDAPLVEEQQTTPEQTEAAQTVRESILASAFVPEEDAQELGTAFPELQAVIDERGRLDRHTEVNFYGQMLDSKDLPQEAKPQVAVAILSALDKSRASDSTQIQTALAQLPEDHVDRQAHARLIRSTNKLESSPVIQKAKKQVLSLDAETVHGMLDFTDISEGRMDSPAAKATLETLATIGRYNPTAVPMADYDMVLNQTFDEDQENPVVSLIRRSIAAARGLAQELLQGEQAKEEIVKAQKAAVDALPPEQKSASGNRLYRPRAEVKKDVLERGNQNNGKLSLIQHRARFDEAFAAGRIEEAKDALQELRNFAVSQINKVGAYNASAEKGDGSKVPFMAYGNGAFFMQEDAKPWVNTRHSVSVATAMDTHVDTQMVAGLYNALLSAYQDQLGALEGDLAAGPLEVPALHDSIRFQNNVTPKQTEASDATPSQSEEASQPAEDLEVIEDTSPISEDTNAPDPAPALATGTEASADTAAAETVTAPQEQPAQESAEAADDGIQEDRSIADAEERLAAEAVDDGLSQPDPKRTLKDAFTGIFQDKDGNNFFLKAFSRKAEGSTLLDHVDPARAFKERLAAGELDVLNNEEKAVRDLLDKQLPKILEAIQQRMVKALNEKTKSGKNAGLSLLDRLESGSHPVLAYANALPLNFLVQGQDGSYALDQRVLQAAVMGAFEWIMESGSRSTPFYDDEDIRKKLSLAPNALVTQDMRNAVRGGVHLQAALDRVAEKTMELVGVTPNRSEAVVFTQGIFRALGANVFDVLSDQDWLDYTLTPYQSSEGPRTYATLSVTDSAYMNRLSAVMQRIPDVFTRAFVPGHEKLRYVGSAPKGAAATQLRNRLAPLSTKERKVIDRLQKIEHRLNMPLYGLMQALGREMSLAIQGHQEVDEDRFNENHLKSIVGRNRSLETGWAGLEGYVAEIDAHSKEAGLELEEVPVFFEYAVNANGRLFQRGPITPQANKFMREMVTATRSTLDLNDPVQSDVLWLGVAQAADLSIEKMDHVSSIAEAKAMMNDPDGLRPAVQLIEEWLRTGELDEQQRTDLIQAVTTGPAPASMKLVHALVTVARVNTASAEELGAFETDLAVEADGKTDGPINAMVHMKTGRFEEEDVRILAKGGLFFSADRISLNDYISQMDDRDLYHVGAARLEESLQEIFGSEVYFESQEERDHALRTLRILDAFMADKDFMFKEDPETGTADLEIGRNITKNPLTVFLYGSGVAGISGKVADAIKNRFYEVLSEIAAGEQSGDMQGWQDHPVFRDNPGLIADMEQVLFREVPPNRDWAISPMPKDTNLATALAAPKEASLGFKVEKNLQNAIQRFFGEPLADAVDQATGRLSENMRLLQSAAQVQSLVFQEAFQAAVDKRMEEDEYVSEKLLEDAFQDAMKVAPIYNTDAHSFHVFGSEKYDTGKTISSSFDKSFAASAMIKSPSEAGVKASPYMTIGTGDGRMILNIYLDADGALDVSLPVFDGVELATGAFVKGSEQINASVYDGWMGQNVFQTVLDGYDAFLRNADLNEIEDATYQKLKRALGVDKKTDLTMQHFTDLQTSLSIAALESQARKNAMKRMHVWVDHMAGADAPSEHVGEPVQHQTKAYDTKAVAERLNAFYEEELTNLRKDKGEQAAAETIQPATDGLKDMIEAVGEPVENSAAKKVSGKAITSFVKRQAGFASEQTKVFWDLLKKDGTLDEFTFFFGSREDLEAIRDRDYGHLPKRPIEAGQAFAGSKVVFIAHASPETLLHEALHTHTGARLISYYKDPAAAPEYVRDAVTRLEDLMGQVRTMRFSKEPDNIRRAGQHLQKTLARLEGQSAAQMSEFLSWMLSNQNLIELGKKQQVYSPIQKIGLRVLKALKNFLGIKSRKGTDLFSNIRFNTEVFLSTPDADLLAEADANVQTLFEQTFGENPRLEQLERKFLHRLQTHLAGLPRTTQFEKMQSSKRQADLHELSRLAAESATANGYVLDAREASAFRAIHSALLSGMEMNSAAIQEANKLFQLALDHGGDDDFLTGAKGLRRTANNRSDLLATFLALGMVHEGFRERLSKVTLPKAFEIKEKSLDGAVRSISNGLNNLLVRSAVDVKQGGRTVLDRLNVLSQALSEEKAERRLWARLNAVSRLDDVVAPVIDKASSKASQALQKRAGKTEKPAGKAALNIAGLVAAVGSKEGSEDTAEAMTRLLNQSPRFELIRNLWRDMRGMSPKSADLFRMINKVKSEIDAMRQDYREGIPRELAKRFSRPLDKKEWETLHRGIAQTDLTALGREDALAVLKDPSRIGSLIRQAEKDIDAVTGKDLQLYKRKAQELAAYMMERKTAPNLLRNAEAIAKLFGEGVKDPAPATKELVEAIDRLTSLYALQKLDPAEQESLKALAEQEEEGLRTVTGYHLTTRAWEKSKQAKGKAGYTARYNGWKGYSPMTETEGQKVIVEDDAEAENLARMGFKRVSDYEGDPAEGYRGSRGVYVSSVAGKGAFRQGVAQTVHSSFMGVDDRTGVSRTGLTAGAIMGQAAKTIAKRTTPNRTTTNHLLPIYDGEGGLIGYDRTMAPDHLALVQRNTRMDQVLGNWSGRILEEDLADQSNKDLVAVLKTMHETAVKEGRANEFVNVADPDLKDRVIKDAWDVLGHRIKAEVAEQFGDKDFFPIRRDLIDDAIGFRSATLTDPWTGVSRWSDETQQTMVRMAQLVAGNAAYRWIKTAEGHLRSVVSYAKTNIVVRSVVVTWENTISNAVHMLTWGVNPATMLKSMRAKKIELDAYLENREKILSLNTELSALGNKDPKAHRIKAKLRALADANERLSIHELIKAGEFSTVSEDLTEADQALRDGKLGELLEKVTDRLPGVAKTIGKNFVLTKDTELYKVLNRAVQYGDFLSKAVLYDHLTQEKGMTKEAALDVLQEEFVNYNRLAGRGRDFLESIGLLWFYNYKLRIMKVAHRMLRERPVSALLYAGGLGPMIDADTVLTGSLAGNIADGSMGYSVGWEMGINGYTLNPWINLVD
jgi:hypothetical protein